jgi:hypothetical protein
VLAPYENVEMKYHVCAHPQDDLARSGYTLDMKVYKRKKENPSIFLATYSNLS